MDVRLQLVILASAFVADSTLWWLSCLPHVVLRAQLFVKVGASPRALWFRTNCLGYGLPVMVWGQVIRETEVFQFGPGAKPWYGVWCPRSQLFVKMGAHAAVPCGVGDTVSDILMVTPAGVIDVYYVSFYSR